MFNNVSDVSAEFGEPWVIGGYHSSKALIDLTPSGMPLRQCCLYRLSSVPGDTYSDKLGNARFLSAQDNVSGQSAEGYESQPFLISTYLWREMYLKASSPPRAEKGHHSMSTVPLDRPSSDEEEEPEEKAKGKGKGKGKPTVTNVRNVEAFKKQLDSVDSVSFSPKTFAATYKLALDHFKKEVSAGFVVFILKKLLDMHNIEEDDFKAELMTRYSTESPSLDKPGQHHFSSVNNQLFKGTMDAAVSKSGTKASGVMFATEEVGQTAVEGLSKPMTAQAWFSRLQLDYATTRRDALDLRGTSELLMPKLTITEFKKANGFITFQTNNHEVNCQLNWWLTVIESRGKKVQERTHSDTVISASVTDIELLTQPDMVYSSLSGGAVGAISDDMAKFLQAVRVLLLAYPIVARISGCSIGPRQVGYSRRCVDEYRYLVREYSNKGNWVMCLHTVDGSGMLAALLESRSVVGLESVPQRLGVATWRLKKFHATEKVLLKHHAAMQEADYSNPSSGADIGESGEYACSLVAELVTSGGPLEVAATILDVYAEAKIVNGNKWTASAMDDVVTDLNVFCSGSHTTQCSTDPIFMVIVRLLCRLTMLVCHAAKTGVASSERREHIFLGGFVLPSNVSIGEDGMPQRMRDSPVGLTPRSLGAVVGDETHTLVASEMPSHVHSGTTDAVGAHSHATNAVGGQGNAGLCVADGNGTGTNMTTDSSTGELNVMTTPTALAVSAAGNHAHAFTSGSTGLGQANNNMQPTLFGGSVFVFTGHGNAFVA
eukprot:gene9506-biopygen8051